MKLKTLEIHNLGVHRHLKIRFGEGLTGIFGPQGSGKSTVIAGVYAGITNDFSRISDVKQGAICQQSQGERSGVEVLLEANKDQIILSRMLAPTASNRLRTKSGLNITNDNKIREEITRLLGASRGLLDNYVFVDQWEVRSLFKATATQRAEAMSLLCGTKFIDTCYANVMKMREADLNLLNQGLEDIDRLKHELADYKRMLSVENKTLEDLEGKILPQDQLSVLNELVLNYSLASKLERERGEIQKKLADGANERASLEEQVKECEGWLREAELEEAAARSDIKVPALQQELYDTQIIHWKAKCDLEKDIAELEEQLKPFGDTGLDGGQTISDYDELIAELDEQMAPLSSIIRQFEKLPDLTTCPTCGQSLEDFKVQLEAAREKIGPLANERELLVEARLARLSKEREYAEYLQNQKRAQESLDKLRPRLLDYQEVSEPVKPNTALLEKRKQALAKAQKEVETARKELSSVQGKLFSITQAQAELVKQLAEATAHLKDLSSDPEAHATAKARLEEDQANKQSIAASQARCAEYQRVIEARQAAISDAEKSRAEAQRVREWVDLLTKTLPILHRDGLPKAVHSRAMRQVEGEINEKLEEFECPFRVKTGDDLSYIAKFCNGTEVPAHRLSGGQQVVLSLAMRWALNSLFASQIGLLTLDEPTAGLDERHLGLLESTLSKLGAAARNRGCQVIIITHEKRLRGVFDQVIELERPVL